MKLSRRILFLMLFSAGVMAQDVKVVGTVDQTLNNSTLVKAKTNVVKHITLLKIALSDKALQKVVSRVDSALKHDASLSVGPTKSVQLGMGSVPVLDQGSFGSCVTFADTAAVDAVLNKGDYISQLCQLQLGRYLENNGYNPSGWEGSLGGVVLNQMSAFGIVSKDQQVANGCGGVTEYPVNRNDPIPGTEMSLIDYHQLSEPMDYNVVSWSSVLDIYQVFADQTNLSTTLIEVKAVLNAGDRLTFGVLLPSVNKGTAGAVGKHNATNDSWVLTPEIVKDMQNDNDMPGHEMVITGYDDNAVAIDDHGRTHRGLLSLRNSWGASIGDKGNFYMSYDYFKTLVIEVQRVRNLAD